MIFAGIDLSTRYISVAGVTLDEEWVFAEAALDQPGKLAGRGVREALREAGCDSAFWDQVACCWVERAFGHSLVVDRLAAVRGAVLDAVPDHVVVDVISTPEWRKVMGWGNASRDDAKRHAREWVEHRIGRNTLSEDCCEAACVAWVCLSESLKASST